MTRSMSIRRALVAGAGTAAVAATLLAAPGTPTSATPRAADEPSMTLRTGADRVTAWKYGKWTELDLGTYVVAGDGPFDIRVRRTSYDEPIEGVLRTPDGDLPLPDGAVGNSFRGLAEFYRLRITDADGKTVLSRTSPFCPNGETVRIRPDAPATSRYPLYCGSGNPFTLGAVWGFEAGHGIPMPPTYSTRAKLPVGRYHATLRITRAYRQAFGLSQEQATAEIRVRVRRSEDCDELCRAPRRHGAHSDVLEPGPRPAGSGRVPETGPRPDLRSLPAWGIRVRKGRFLKFSATVWNAGDSPLVVDGFRRRNENLMDAYQYFFDADGDQTGYDRVGTMEWDSREDHHHWHFTDFARYRLVDADKEGVVRSKKESFCLANTDAVDYTVDGANWQPDNTDLHSACGEKGSLGLREVLDSGSGDTYAQFRPGQSFVLKGIPNGTYFIEVKANPVRNLTESDTSNNVSYRKVIIKGKPGERTVTVPPVGLVDHR